MLCFIACLLVHHVNSQQITIDDSLTTQQLIEDNLVQGCVQVSDITSSYNGSVNGFSSYGYFERASSNFPFENGIVLSSGNVNSAGNVLNVNPLNEGDNNWVTDPDLEAALGITNTLNATSIEFDFISASSTIQFNYILASEEYFNNYPCNYSDGFAFLIKEAGSNAPFQNIAVIPGTTTPVNTSTIHDEIVGFCDADNAQFFEGYNIGDTNFNGRTTVMSALANITPNVQYQIKLIIADQTDRNFDSAVFIEGNSFTDSVNLGEDISSCNASTTLDAETNNPDATYVWFLNGNELTETSSNLFVDTSGSYTVEITVPLGSTTCTFSDDINITLNSIETGPVVSDFVQCDDASNDGVESFDLTTKTAEVEAALPPSVYTISYHISNTNAVNNNNPLNAVTNIISPQTIHVRAEDTTTGCVYITTFSLIVNSFPIITDPNPIEICSNGSNEVVLTNYNDGITNNNGNLQVTYHYSQIDADTGANPIASPYIPTNPNEDLFIAIVDITTGCSAFTSVTINTTDGPNVNGTTQQLNACEQDDDGIEVFDLTTIINDVLQGATGLTITFHVSQEDANAGVNPIADPANYQNTIPDLEIIYIRVENDSNSCFSVIPLELHANILETGTNIRDFGVCDVAPDDGTGDFNLEVISETIINNLEGVNVIFYETELDQQNNTNPIDPTVSYEVNNTQTLYIFLENVDCDNVGEIELTVYPSVTITNTDPVTYCETDDDTLTSVELSTFDSVVTQGMSNATVAYYATMDDALNRENELLPFYDNTSNPFTLYVRVTGSVGCFDIAPLIVEVLPAPTVTPSSDYVVCDDDQDAFSVIDLTSKISEIVSDTNGLNISFFPTEDDANNSTNEIVDNANFNTQTTNVITKVENQVTGCYALVPISIIINTLPEFISISNFRNCETDGNQIADFVFLEKDEEILNGQTGKEVLYFETAQDAIDRSNIIDKNNIYNNTSPIQTIYVRVENTTDNDCYGASSFIIEVGSEPIYNAPLDIFACDDISNDGFETFDLSEQINAVMESSPEALSVTIHLTLEEAQNQENPLPNSFTNTVNPQELFVSIDNGTYCQGLATFEYNVVQIPEVSSASALRACDTDTDGSISFDLTVAEFEVLAIRQDDTIVTYYENEDDLNAGANPITDPTDYTNVTNPQIVYISITNTISNCSANVPIELIVDLPPTIADISVFETCTNEDNFYDLNETVTPLIGNQQNVAISFYTSLMDAESMTNPLNTDYTFVTNSDTIYIRAEFTDTNCVNYDSFTIQVNPLPVINSIPNLEACDDDFDLILSFDLSQQTTLILGSQNPNDFTVSYFTSEEDALTNENGISNLDYTVEGTQTFFIRVENNETNCYDTASFDATVNRKPFVEVTDQVICLDNLPLIVSADTNVATDTYLWSTNEISNTIEIDEIGQYSVTVTSVLGCSTTSTFNVIQSEAAVIEFTATVDFADPNNITVVVGGTGDYLYQLDDGIPQESSFFGNVAIGPHVITVIDVNGCNSTSKDVVIIDAPQFVTPNGDGYFDTWHITGVNQLPGTVVYIFDRYGKLLTTLKHDSYGWDGNYHGHAMPANDYWFLAKVVKGSLKFEVKGHFALRR
jgi:gliding motility-associated-like protein